MIGIAIANSLGLSATAAAPDPSASAYFAATGITGMTQQQAIDNLVKGLKSDGLWSKMKAVYPFVTDNRNLLSYTEDFSNAYWPKNGSSVTSNTTIAPNGTTTADSLIEDGTTGAHRLTPSITTGSTGQITYSVYAKYNGRQYVVLALSEFSGTDRRAWFDIQNGTIGTVNTNLTASISNEGNGWYRCAITIANSTSSNFPYIWMSNADASLTYAGNGTSGIYLWGAQLELGSTATTYQPIATTQQAFISSQFKYNLVNPVDSDAAFRLVFNGGWTHSANGATPNGTNGYADTKFNPFSNSLTTASAHLSYYARTQATTSDPAEIGNFGVGNIGLVLQSKSSSSSNRYFYNFSFAASRIVATAPVGFMMGSSVSNTRRDLYLNGTSVANNTTTDTITFLNYNLFLGAANINNSSVASYTNSQCAFASIGNGLTTTEAYNLYTRVQAFQTQLSRQV